MKHLISLLFVFQIGSAVGQPKDDTLYTGIITLAELDLEEVESKCFADSAWTGSVRDRLKMISHTQDTSAADLWTKLGPLIEELKQIKMPKKKTKYIENIYQTVHGEFFKKYVAEITFDKIFTKGEYNCVTASALYGLVFEELGIPYQLKKLPTHVYIVAYPEEQIVVESTNPRSSFFQFDSQYKSQFINELVESKIIARSELSEHSVDELFNEHYFEDQVIGWRELMGVQYLNQGIFALRNKDYKLALKEFEKACYLYPNKYAVVDLVLTMGQLLDKADYTNDRDVSLLARISRINDMFKTDQNDVRNEFLHITQDLLIDRAKKERYEEVYKLLGSKITNDSLRGELDYIFNYEMGRYHLLKGSYEKAQPFALFALKAKPTNLESQSMVLETYREQFQRMTTEDKPDAAKLDEFIHLKDSIPLLWDNGNYKRMYSNVFAVKGAYLIDGKNYGGALEFLDELVKVAEETHERPAQEFMSGLCGEVGKYYFKRGDYTTARKAVNIGLDMYPADSYLLMIKSQLK